MMIIAVVTRAVMETINAGRLRRERARIDVLTATGADHVLSDVPNVIADVIDVQPIRDDEEMQIAEEEDSRNSETSASNEQSPRFAATALRSLHVVLPGCGYGPS